MLLSRSQLKQLVSAWQQLTPLTQGLLLLILVNTVLVLPSILLTLSDRFIFDLPVKPREIPQYHLWQFLRLRQDLDSWEPMWQAFEQIKAAPKEPLYAQIFFDENTKFQYPLTSLLLFYALQAVLAPFSSQYPETLYQLLAIISWLSFFGLLIVSVKIFSASQCASGSDKTSVMSIDTGPRHFEQTLRILLLLGLGLTFYPAIRAYSLGQIQAWINLLFSLMLWGWFSEKKRFSGVLGGLICLIKPQYAVILLWSLLRRQWQFAIAFLSVTAAGWLTACMLFGLSNNLDYLKVLSFISKRGEAYYPNQSVNGLMNRLLFNGSNLQWTGDAFAPFNGWIYACTLFSSVLLLIFALRSPRRAGGSVADFALVSLTATMASPVAWEHHYGILLPIYAMLLPQLLQHRIWSSFTLPLLGLSYGLSSNYFYVAREFADLPLLNVLQSYLFFGALIVLLSLYRLRDRDPLTQPIATKLP
jgi:alpha-1,2-mannosyltransferase